MTSRVTVVVPVFNRAAELNKLVSALERQTLPRTDWDLFICDDGSSEDLAAAIEPTFVEIKWLRQKQSGPAAARNLGLAAVVAPIVAFTDSDCIPAANWLEELIRPIESNEADVVGGFVGFEIAEEWTGRCLNYVMTTGIGAGGARDPRSSIGMRFYARSGNMAIRTSLARLVGGFPNERYGEDVEFGRRLSQVGARLTFAPPAAVVHNEKRTIRQAGREAFKKGAARIRLTQRYGFKEVIHAGPAGLVTYLTVVPFLALAWPDMVPYAIAPIIIYLLALLVLAIQGTRALRDLRAAVTVPLLAFVLHIGYGLGYLSAGIRTLFRKPAGNRPPLSPLPSMASSSELSHDRPPVSENIAVETTS